MLEAQENPGTAQDHIALTELADRLAKNQQLFLGHDVWAEFSSAALSEDLAALHAGLDSFQQATRALTADGNISHQRKYAELQQMLRADGLFDKLISCVLTLNAHLNAQTFHLRGLFQSVLLVSATCIGIIGLFVFILSLIHI